MKRCPHADPPMVICGRCVQTIVEPPPPPRAKVERTGEKKRRPRGWKVTLPDGKSYTYEGVSLATARGALRRTLGKRGPPGVKWDPTY